MKVQLLGSSKLPSSARKPALLKKAALLGLGALAKKPGELNLIFVSDKEIRRINKKHLAHDYATDVIAFPYSGDAFPGMQAGPFGDVVVSVDRARAQAKELGHPLLKEVLTLCAHGALHLAGHDDHDPKAKARMFKRQDAILERLRQ